MAEARILMDGAYAYLAACYKRKTDHCIAELNGCLSTGTWLKSSFRAGRFFQESAINDLLKLTPPPSRFTKTIGTLQRLELVSSRGEPELATTHPPTPLNSMATTKARRSQPATCGTALVIGCIAKDN
jgi:hypothetical protein